VGTYLHESRSDAPLLLLLLLLLLSSLSSSSAAAAAAAAQLPLVGFGFLHNSNTQRVPAQKYVTNISENSEISSL
jgi:hypothetical protein